MNDITHTMISYGLSIAGSTPSRDFVMKRGHGRLSGLDTGTVGDGSYSRYYVRDYLFLAARMPEKCGPVKVRRWYAVLPGEGLAPCPRELGAALG